MARGRGKKYEEETYYEEEHSDRRSMRDQARDRRAHVLEEDIEIRHRPANTRFREVDRDFFKERVRSSSAGPLVLRQRVSDEFVHVPREVEREVDEVRIMHPRAREREIELEEHIIRRRGKSRPREPVRRLEEEEIIIRERDYDSDQCSRRRRRRPAGHAHEIDIEIDHGRHRDEVVYRSMSRERPRPRPEEREEIVIRTDEKRCARGREVERDEIIIRKEVERSPSPEPSVAPPQTIQAPAIHQDVITHHRHIDHGESNLHLVC